MPTRIAHLSDLHYGSAFDIALWRSVENTVATFNPHLLIVSGDMVDDPRQDHMWAAKQALDGLATSLGARLYVVAGNHDLFLSGLDMTGGRSGWFDHIFNGTAAPAASIPPPGTAPGFTRLEPGFWQTLKDRARVFLGLGVHAAQPPPPSPDGIAASMLREPEQTPVLLALIDSNAADEPVRLATGSVSTDDLVLLDTQLQGVSTAHLARIAVIHHHLLPIPHTAGRIVGAEPFMVLHNAGDVLGLLARHRFDLVLHGHKHRAQFARIDLAPDSAEGYPIAVVAAGSAALRTPNNPLGNSFNLITIQDNGRIDVESLHYGAGTAPNRDGRKGEAVKKYTETIETTKRRAFIRACQRHPILCIRRALQFEISELGDLVVYHRTVGLRVLRGNSEYRKRPHIVHIPPHGRLVFDLRLDAASLGEGYTIEPVVSGAPNGRRMVVLRENLTGDQEASYAVSHAGANCMMMTRWEAEERALADERAGRPRTEGWDEEGVSFYIGHPIEEVEFSLALPASLAEVHPYLRCERRRGFPEFEINTWGDAEVPPGGVSFDIDTDMEAEERRAPRYDPADGMWHLVIRHPVVGYRYRLRWPTPGTPPDEPVPGETLQWRELLLAMADRAEPTTTDAQAQRVFGLLADEFEKRLCWGGAGERHSVKLFVYDTAKLALRPVVCRSSCAPEPNWRDFLIPLGDGIAGAAFQRRSIVPWAKETSGSVFIKPVPIPNADVEMRTMLAVPVYHPKEQDKPRPSPWATIGVVSFSSSSPASKVPLLLNRKLSEATEEMLTILRGLAQAHVHDIITTLSQLGRV